MPGLPGDDVPSVKLAEIDTKPGEPLVMVSYGYNDVVNLGRGYRRFCENRLTQAPGTDGRVVFDPRGRRTYQGDSGSACLRPTLTGPLGEEASFTSTFSYRDWVGADPQVDLSARPKVDEFSLADLAVKALAAHPGGRGLVGLVAADGPEEIDFDGPLGMVELRVGQTPAAPVVLEETNHEMRSSLAVALDRKLAWVQAYVGQGRSAARHTSTTGGAASTSG